MIPFLAPERLGDIFIIDNTSVYVTPTFQTNRIMYIHSLPNKSMRHILFIFHRLVHTQATLEMNALHVIYE